MKHIPLLATLILPATLFVTRPATAQNGAPKSELSEAAVRQCDATAAALVRLIGFQLPRQVFSEAGEPQLGTANWSVWYQPQFNTITVQREQAVLMDRTFEGINFSGGLLSKTTLQYPRFSLRVEPLVSTADYIRFQAENKTIEKKLFEMRDGMRNISHKFDQFLPRNEEEKTQVDIYNRLARTVHSNLPDFYFRDISLSWSNLMGGTMFSQNSWKIVDVDKDELEIWRREQAEAAKSVLLILSHYER